jgi:hypothetical protein
MLRLRVCGVVGLVVVVAAACHDAPTTSPEESAAGAAAPGRPGYSTLTEEPADYPLHYYGDESDNWPYMTALTGTYVEIVAADQTPQPYDNDASRRVCPNDQLVGRNAHLRMNYRLETLDFDFRGPFTFVRHVSTTSPYPTALYIFNRNAYTRDNKYYAPARNNVLLACDGRYVFRNNVIRVWTGHFYGKLYNGPIVRNPEYEDCEDGGGGGGAGTQLIAVTGDAYDPYDPQFSTSEVNGDSSNCGSAPTSGTTTGSGTQYEPGDNTGGETVDWGTGVGNGGESACGDTAIVQYVCIDYWVKGVGWVEWSCGYATAC